MRSITILLIVLFFINTSNDLIAQGCCSVSIPTLGSTESPSIGFGSMRIGLNYLYTNTSTTYKNDTKIQDPLSRKAFGHNVVIDFEFGVWENLSLFFLLPYNHYYRSTTVSQNQKEVYQNNGLGDLTILLKYNVINPTFAMPYQLSLGSGLKLPTGEFQTESQGVQLPLDIQSGTGTLDFIIWGFLTANFTENLTLTQSALFKFAGKNTEGYDIGNELLTVTGLIYNFADAIQGNILFRAQSRWKDRLDIDNSNQLIPNSGRILIEAIPGLVFNYLNILTTRIFFVYPIYIKVNGTQLSPSWRIGTEFHYSFNLF
jgi:hypothetical protein